MSTNIKGLLRNASFVSLWLGQSFSQLAESLYVIGVMILIYAETESLQCSVIFPFIRGITSLLGGFFAPLVLQKIPLRLLLISTQIAQAIILLLLTLYLNQYQLFIPVLSIFVVMLAFLDAWSYPSRSSMVPRIVTKTNLIQANSLISTTDQFAMGIGFSLGGVLISKIGTTGSLIICVILFFISGLLSFSIKDPIGTPEKIKSASWKSLKKTWSFVYKHPIYRRLFTLDALEFMAVAVWTGAITLVFVEEVLHKNKVWWGFINGAHLLGTTLGGLVAISINTWLLQRLRLSFIIGSANQAVLTIIFALFPQPMLSLILAFLMGIPYQVRDVALKTLLQTNADHAQLPQIFSVHKVILNIATSIGLIIMGTLSDFYGPQTAYIVSAIFVLGSVVMAIFLPLEKHSSNLCRKV